MNTVRCLGSVLTLAASVLLISCGNNHNVSDDEAASLDARLGSLIQMHKLTGDPSIGRTLIDIDDPLAQLGKKLFFTKAYSLNNDTACVSCHHPWLAGGDALSMPVGTDALDPDLLGIGRAHKATPHNTFEADFSGPRNSPTTFNVAFYDQFQFWDGKIESQAKTSGTHGVDSLAITPKQIFPRIVEVAFAAMANGTYDFTQSMFVPPDTEFVGLSLTAHQARFPVTSRVEMRGFAPDVASLDFDGVWRRIEARFQGDDPHQVAANNSWLSEFRQGFNRPTASKEELISIENIDQAVSAYEQSQVFVSSPWKQYVDGNGSAISDTAKQGALLFYTDVNEGGAGCVSCHSGDFFTDERFHVVAFPQVGRGKAGLPSPFPDSSDQHNPHDDKGRFLLTLNKNDEYAFRTPTLLNVSATGPWGHNGAYNSLRAVVEHYNDPEQSLLNYSPDEHLITYANMSIKTDYVTANSQLALQKLNEIRSNKSDPDVIPRRLNLAAHQVDQLVVFLETLTDPCVLSKACLAPWVISSDDVDPDGMQLQATFERTVAQ